MTDAEAAEADAEEAAQAAEFKAERKAAAKEEAGGSGSDSSSDSDSDSDSDSGAEFSFGADDDDDEEVEVVVDRYQMSPEEEAKLIAECKVLVANALEKIEAKNPTLRSDEIGNRYESHVTGRTLTGKQGHYIIFGDPEAENNAAADADLMPNEGDEGEEGEEGEEAEEEEEPAYAAVPTGMKKWDVFEEQISPTWYDPIRERRVQKLGTLRRRGKGPPKKGSGKRTKKKGGN